MLWPHVLFFSGLSFSLTLIEGHKRLKEIVLSHSTLSEEKELKEIVLSHSTLSEEKDIMV